MNKKQFQNMLDQIVKPNFIDTAIQIKSDHSLTDIQAYHLAIVLKQTPHIIEIDLSNDITQNRGVEDQGAIALANVATLKIIELYCNSITVVGVTALAKSTLTKLLLSGNPIYYTHNNHGIFQEMIDNFCNNKTIITLDLSYSIIPDKMIAQLINENNTIQTFISPRNLGDKALEFIGNNITLKELIIYENQLTNQGVDYLSTNTNLEILHIGCSNINDNGIKAFTNHPSLQHLALIDSNITKEGTKSFFNSNIKEVNLFNTFKHDFISSAEISQFMTNFYNFKQNQKTLVSKLSDSTIISEEKQLRVDTIDENEIYLTGDSQDE